ncbi:DUF2617 family protein [Botrimarina mediterranea]|uniref:DUF2617 domain-containing protein n=1 Tax=Botrimarina mediterranea TaxID=2528022 RepID=A0A518KDN7_9BACT|nr:DUF2617 family protein [Botrimarina mediterranea]QDV75908.1 hypothetical protein Spa11_41310 [Botrimarina mediterranea]QDV80503.1 hypothetical protein K2D_41320 [Planctomycetes bacterium K2D]
MLSVRPKIAELVMQLYGRALHPELFEVFAQKRLERGKVAPPPRSIAASDGVAPAGVSGEIDPEADGYEAIVAITSAGHVVHWRHRGLTLTEVCASSHQPLPQRRRLMSHRVEGERSDRVECRGGIVYETSLALETASSEALYAYQHEFDLMNLQGGALPLGEGGDSNGLLHRFEASGRAGLSMGALSFVDIQSRDRSLRVRALHTFPDDCAIVKTESVFRLPG